MNASAVWVISTLLIGADPSIPAISLSEPLRVGVAGSKPFVLSDQERLSGASVEIWRLIASGLKLEYTLVHYDNVDALIDAVATGTIAVGVGPISVTSRRIARIDFTQPYYETRLALLHAAKNRALWDRISPLWSRAFAAATATLLFLLFVAGNLLWIAERHENPEQFPAIYRYGIAEGMWFAIVTMTTVGYGDRVPRTPLGRTVAGIWMVFSMIAGSSITAAIATALTISTLGEKPLDLAALAGRPVAVVHGTSATRIAALTGARVSEWPTREAAIGALQRGESEAVLADAPLLEAWQTTQPSSELTLTVLPLASQDYAFALPPGSVYRRAIDSALLGLWERQRIQTELDAWLPSQ